MSTHVLPDGEQVRHVLTLECPCGPHVQLGFDGADVNAVTSCIVHRSMVGSVEASDHPDPCWECE